MRKLKVIQILPTLNTGGVERGVLDFNNYLVKKGHESYVISNGGRQVKNLIEEGYIGSILLSQDVFIKMMLKKYGGFGYTYIITHFKNRLINLGVSENQISELLIDNPKRVFSFDII